ncbi:hypothetical protein NDU88_000169 [Pleurodeles waltl]|uniref:DDE Tnp4 domain-containing protein n=1 Tax=Pleurodeles waltl TaxID=8319 RepID=A0AAV7P1R6_PLEWA|nr:hypothetical protein NDU88_000169 [Pleurodeles waltl]
MIERTFGLLKARFRCLHMTGGSLFYSPKKVCQIIVACCMLHNLALRRQMPFLQEDGPDAVLLQLWSLWTLKTRKQKKRTWTTGTR